MGALVPHSKKDLGSTDSDFRKRIYPCGEIKEQIAHTVGSYIA